jgi:uncharacterized protein YacL
MTRRRDSAEGVAVGVLPRPSLDARPGDHPGDAPNASGVPAPPRGRRSRSSWWRGPAGGRLAEFVRLILVVVFALAGWQLAVGLRGGKVVALVTGVTLGSAFGYVFGGMFGRHTANAVSEIERSLGRLPAADILAGGMGLGLGLLFAALLSFPLFHLPPVPAYSTVAFTYPTFGLAGYRIGRSKRDELLALFGMKARAAGTRPGEVAVLDSSVLLDGRMEALVDMGFLTATLLVAREVLDELKAVADSSDPVLRARGRRALDLLLKLKRDPAVDLVLVEEAPVPGEPVDGRLVRLARTRGGVLVTNDTGLARVASALDVPVRSINALAAALRPRLVPGDRTELRLTRRGREPGQAVGYTAEGTMVVVEHADHLVGRTAAITATVAVIVTNSIRSSAGEMLFAALSPAVEAGAEAQPAG